VGWVLSLIAAAVVGIIGLVLVSAYRDSQRPTFELKKDDWTCARSEQRTYLRPMPVGKVTTLMPMSMAVCMEYRRK
jgi:hypothetical protein